jgi:hypothetical protein
MPEHLVLDTTSADHKTCPGNVAGARAALLPPGLVLRRRGGYGNIARAMSPWLSMFIPLLALFFMLGMESLESRVCHAQVRHDGAQPLVQRPRKRRRGAALPSRRVPSRPHAPA